MVENGHIPDFSPPFNAKGGCAQEKLVTTEPLTKEVKEYRSSSGGIPAPSSSQKIGSRQKISCALQHFYRI
jgi:hypothetical protein